MSRIGPIPTTRVSSLYVSQRLSRQVQADQLSLFRLQNQVSSGLRLFLPSDDPASALRGMTVQRILERRDQLQTNLRESNDFLTLAESSVANVSKVLSDIRGAALGASGTVAPDSERQAVANQVDEAIQQLVTSGNATFQGRFLFSGSSSVVQPYDFSGNFVKYQGNENHLRSFVDFSTLIETNLPGTEVFGGISTPVEGSVDLKPHLTNETLVRTINSGEGVSPDGAISIAVGFNAQSPQTTVVDLSNASTLGGVARAIEAAAPADAQISVEVVGDHLQISSDSSSVVSISVAEVGDGVTAKEFGIFTDTSAPASTTLIGTSLNPLVTKTTLLNDLLGTKSQVGLNAAGINNDLIITAALNGSSFDGVTVQFQSGGIAGAETVVYDAGAGTLTIDIAAGDSTATQIAAAITQEGTFVAEVDLLDATSVAQAGTGIIDVTETSGLTSGGGGTTLDLTSGLIVTNGGDPVTLDTSEAETVEDLLNLLNGAGLSLQAEINAAGTRINVRSRLSGADLTIGENGGTTATQLGIRTLTGDTELSSFNRGTGVQTDEDVDLTEDDVTVDDLVIELGDGTSVTSSIGVDLDGAFTVQDVIDLINSDADNGGKVTARLVATGNGIELVNNTSDASLTLRKNGISPAAQQLGFLAEGEESVTTTTGTLQSEDRNTQEVDSAFNTLIRLREALRSNDFAGIGQAIESLDQDLDRANFARAEIGARLRSLEVQKFRLEDEDVQLRSTLSENLDVDLVEAISNLTARQFALQASLQTAGNILQLSLLDFI